MVSWEYFYVSFFNSIACDGFGFSQAKYKPLFYYSAACSEGKDHFSSDQGKADASLCNHNGTAHDGEVLA